MEVVVVTEIRIMFGEEKGEALKNAKTVILGT
jgi:hypothetical protein